MTLIPRFSGWNCSGGGIGRHACLRCMCRKVCRFESCPEHQPSLIRCAAELRLAGQLVGLLAGRSISEGAAKAARDRRTGAGLEGCGPAMHVFFRSSLVPTSANKITNHMPRSFPSRSGGSQFSADGRAGARHHAITRRTRYCQRPGGKSARPAKGAPLRTTGMRPSRCGRRFEVEDRAHSSHCSRHGHISAQRFERLVARG